MRASVRIMFFRRNLKIRIKDKQKNYKVYKKINNNLKEISNRSQSPFREHIIDNNTTRHFYVIFFALATLATRSM